MKYVVIMCKYVVKKKPQPSHNAYTEYMKYTLNIHVQSASYKCAYTLKI